MRFSRRLTISKMMILIAVFAFGFVVTIKDYGLILPILVGLWFVGTIAPLLLGAIALRDYLLIVLGIPLGVAALLLLRSWL